MKYMIYYTTRYKYSRLKETTTADYYPTAETTTAPYCGIDTCQNLALLILDLEQKFNNLTHGFAILQNQNEELKIENQEIKAENEALREDVSQLQGIDMISISDQIQEFSNQEFNAVP